MAGILNSYGKHAASDVLLYELYLDWHHVFRLIRRMGLQTSFVVQESEQATRKPWEINLTIRESLIDDQPKDVFMAAILQSVPENLPQVFIEGYSETRKRALSAFKRFPRVILSASGWFFDETFKFFAAEAAENGTRLLGYQHGGGYGMMRSGPEATEVKMVDRWFGWGHWVHSGQSMGILPNPKLSKLQETDYWNYLGTRKDVLLVATEYPMYLYWILSVPVCWQFEKYIEWRRRFLTHLSPALQKEILVRLHEQGRGWKQADRLIESVSAVRLDDHSVHFLDRLKHVQIAVFDHPGTTFIEAIAFNVPSILFWSRDHWEASEPAEPLLRMLESTGILHHCPERAADKLAEVQHDPALWWLSPDVQAARQLFLRHFGLGKSNWFADWKRELDAEVALSRQVVPQRMSN